MWKKSVASAYAAKTEYFSITVKSLRKLAKMGFWMGIVWGILVVQVYGRPGYKYRKMRSNVTDATKRVT